MSEKGDDESSPYSAKELKRLWALKYEDLAMAPGEPGARLREARYILQVKVAHETRRSGLIMMWATVVMAAATVALVVATYFVATHGG